MAASDPLPAECHVARGCGRGCRRGTMTRVAFKARPQDDGRLSVDWVECAYALPSERNVGGSLSRLRGRLRPQPVAILEVGGIRRIRRNGHHLDAVEEPKPDWSCHGAITGMTGGFMDIALQEGLADLANNGQIVQLA